MGAVRDEWSTGSISSRVVHGFEWRRVVLEFETRRAVHGFEWRRVVGTGS
jgi:hypothetical protein